jgi:hypothetical protein
MTIRATLALMGAVAITVSACGSLLDPDRCSLGVSQLLHPGDLDTLHEPYVAVLGRTRFAPDIVDSAALVFTGKGWKRPVIETYGPDGALGTEGPVRVLDADDAMSISSTISVLLRSAGVWQVRVRDLTTGCGRDLSILIVDKTAAGAR